MENSCSSEHLSIAASQTLLTKNLPEDLSESKLYQK